MRSQKPKENHNLVPHGTMPSSSGKICRDYDNRDSNLNGQMCFVIKEMFHMRLKLQEDIKNIELCFNEIEPCKTTISMGETFVRRSYDHTNKSLSMIPYIRENKLEGSFYYMSG
jgi:hypothetical protein